MKRITLLIVDDYPLTRAGLGALLEDAADVQVIGEADNGHTAIKEARRLLPDIVIMDIAMPLLNGIEAARQITQGIRTTRVIIFSAHSDDHYLNRALQAGAAGYVTKQAGEKHLLEAIRQVHQGHPSFSPGIAAHLMQQWEESVLNGSAGLASPDTLTSRQTEVLQLVAEGFSTKEIAAFLSISVKTVHSHKQLLMNLLEVHGVAALTRYAARHGFVHVYAPGKGL